jgi:hypothetical protein
MDEAPDGNGHFSKNEQWARADEMEAQRGARPSPEKPSYSSPCDRNRVTGSTTACRLKIQRATAKPIAAYNRFIFRIDTPKIQDRRSTSLILRGGSNYNLISAQ